MPRRVKMSNSGPHKGDTYKNAMVKDGWCFGSMISNAINATEPQMEDSQNCLLSRDPMMDVWNVWEATEEVCAIWTPGYLLKGGKNHTYTAR